MKKEKALDIYFKVSGVFLIIVGLIAMFMSIQRGVIGQLLYLCYIGLVIMGLGLFFKKEILIVSQFIIIFIPSLIWDIDYLYLLFTGKYLLNITNYLFDAPVGFFGYFVSLLHIYMIPIILLALFYLRIEKKDTWKFSFLQIGIIFMILRLFTSKEYNINWVFEPTFNFILPLPHVVNWFLILGSFIVITNILLVKIYGAKKKLLK